MTGRGTHRHIALAIAVAFTATPLSASADLVDSQAEQQFVLPPVEAIRHDPNDAPVERRDANASTSSAQSLSVERSAIVSPVEGATLSASTTFSWSDEGASAYLLSVSVNGCFESDVFQRFGITQTQFTVNDLDATQLTYVSLYARTSSGGSYSSRDCVRFSTDVDADGIFNALDPNPTTFDAPTEMTIGGATLSVLATGRVATLTVSEAIYSQLSGGNTSALPDLTSMLYELYQDDFDFIFFTNDQPTSTARYVGLYRAVRNDVEGLGKNLFDSSATYGSSTGRLQGVIHFPDNRSFSNGPGLHELMHRWANSLESIPTQMPAHWGYSSGGGQLGGWAPGTLQTLGSGLYSANNGGTGSTNFGTFANGGNSVPYSNIERYLMGMIPASELETMQYALNAQPDNSGPGRFTAIGIVSVTPGLIFGIDGARLPTFENAQKSFTVLNVILTRDEVDVATLGDFDEKAYRFSLAADDGTTSYNFFEATGGVGTLDMSLGLSSLQPVAAPPPTAPPPTPPPTSPPENDGADEICIIIKTQTDAFVPVCI